MHLNRRGSLSAISAALLSSSGLAAQSSRAEAQSAAAPEPRFPTDGKTDCTDLLNALIAAAWASGGGLVELPVGALLLLGRVTLRNGVGLLGKGNSGSGGYGGTELKMGTSGAGLDIEGDGGEVALLEINGNGIAERPFYVGRVTDRTFWAVDVHDSAGDNVLIEFAQNCSFFSMTSNRANRDGIVLDRSSGGLHFDRVNVSNAGRHAVRITQSHAPEAGSYYCPTHLRFTHCVFERPRTASTLIALESVGLLTFNSCLFVGGPTMTTATALVTCRSAWATSFSACGWIGSPGTNSHGVRVEGWSRLAFDGDQWMQHLGYCFDVPVGELAMNGAIVRDAGQFCTRRSVAHLHAAAYTLRESAIVVRSLSAEASAFRTSLSADRGERFRLSGDGSMHWGDGKGYEFPVMLARRDGGLDLTGDLLISGSLAASGPRFGVRGKRPTTIPVVAGRLGSRTMLKSLLRALEQQGLLRDATT